MKFKATILFLLLGFTVSGCTGDYRGKVVNAETNKPVEGAVVLVEWVAVKGLPGMTHSESVQVMEAVTDKAGNFTVTGASGDTPHVTVYKKGYVAWNSKFIFPDYKKRTGFEWESGYVYRLEMFNEKFSYDEHVSFIRRSIGASQNLEIKNLIFESFRWERTLARKERMKKGLSP